jgi:phage-related protein
MCYYDKNLTTIDLSPMDPKLVQWVGSARDELRDFPDDARLEAGLAIWAVQQGEAPPDSRPMSIVGKSVQEIRIRTTDAYRVFYVAKFSEAIYILHAFQKKTQKTARTNIELGQQRYKQLLHERQQENNPNA